MAKVTLTFDNGPEPGVTDGVLDMLARRGIRATFFVIGRKLQSDAGRRLAARARAEGHLLGNHTYTHTTPLGRLAAAESLREIIETQALLGDLAPERLFRPYGVEGRLGPHLLSAAARDYLVEQRFTCALWNAVPGDWRDPEGWADVALVMCRGRTWATVVLHDLPTGAMRLLPSFLDRLAETGAEFVQDFPLGCTPIIKGKCRPGLERYVT
jgi:peptidoglycan/xylan/chitin deacetylase (PgdA/CDA1 family)